MIFDAGRGFAPENWGENVWLTQTPTSTIAPTQREVSQAAALSGWLGVTEQNVITRASTFRITRLPTLRLKSTKFFSARIRFQEGEWVAEAVDLPLYGSGETVEEAQAMLAREIESLWDDLHRPRRRSARWENIKLLLSRVIVAE